MKKTVYTAALMLLMASPAYAVRTPIQAYAAGSLSLADRNYGSAGRYFNAALAAAPNDVVLRRRAFELTLAGGDMDRALNLAQDISKQDKTISAVNLVLIADAIKRGDYALADKRLAATTEVGLDVLILPILKAWVAAGQKKYDIAEDRLAVLDRTPNFRQFRLEHIGWIELYAGRLDKSSAAFTALLGDTPNGQVRAQLGAATALQKMGNMPAAQKILGSDSTARGAVNLIEAKAKLAAGEQLVSPVRSVQDGVAEAFALVAVELAHEEINAQSVAFARLSAWMSPDNSTVQLALADILLEAGQKTAALDVVAAIKPNTVPADQRILTEAGILDGLDKRDDAIVLVNTLVKAAPGRIGGWSSLGDLYRQQEKFDQAIEAYNKAIALAKGDTNVAHVSNDWGLYFVRGICLERSKHWDAAEADLKTALTLKPEEPSVLNYLGYSWIEQRRNFDQAIAMIEKAVDLKPDDGFIRDSLGWAHYTVGRYDKAVTNLEQAIANQPGDPTINEHLGDAYWQAGRQLEARHRWQASLDSVPDAEQKLRVQDKVRFGMSEPLQLAKR